MSAGIMHLSYIPRLCNQNPMFMRGPLNPCRGTVGCLRGLFVESGQQGWARRQERGTRGFGSSGKLGISNGFSTSV